FTPALPARPPQPSGGFGGAAERDVRVVVEGPETRFPPPDDDGVTGSAADADRRAKALRPPFRWPQVGLGPVEGPHSARHSAVGREEMLHSAAVEAVGAAHDAPPAA